MGRMSRVKLVGLGFVFLWFLLGGVAHFAATELEMSIVPRYVPWPRLVVYMLEHAEQFSAPYALLVLRLPLQVGLLVLIA